MQENDGLVPRHERFLFFRFAVRITIRAAAPAASAPNRTGCMTSPVCVLVRLLPGEDGLPGAEGLDGVEAAGVGVGTASRLLTNVHSCFTVRRITPSLCVGVVLYPSRSASTSSTLYSVPTGIMVTVAVWPSFRVIVEPFDTVPVRPSVVE